MSDPCGGIQGELKCRRVGDAGAVEIGRRQSTLLGKAADLVTGPVDQRHADAQTTQEGHIGQQVAEVLVLYDSPVNGDDESTIAELRHIAEDFAEVGEVFHGAAISAACGLAIPPAKPQAAAGRRLPLQFNGLRVRGDCDDRYLFFSWAITPEDSVRPGVLF